MWDAAAHNAHRPFALRGQVAFAPSVSNAFLSFAQKSLRR
jgi:hypothetical protein